MRVVAYRFEEKDEASRARDELADVLALPAADAELAEFADGGVVLGLRAREELLDTVTKVAREHGGEPLVDVPEAWTRRPDYAN